MHKGRLETFTDGVIAILITIMVLDLRAPAHSTWATLFDERQRFVMYALSFTFLAIYWNNHHHMFQAVEKIDGSVLWASMHLLFWLSITPFVTQMVGHEITTVSVAAYGFVLLLSGIAYYILVQTLLNANGRHSHFAKALGNDLKGKISPMIYAIAILLSFVAPYLSCVLYFAVACMWLVPDKRFIRKEDHPEHP